MPSWRDPTNEDKRPLRMSEVMSHSSPPRDTLFSSILPVTVLIVSLGLVASIFYFLYSIHLRISELTVHLNYNEQNVNNSTGKTKSNLEQVSATLNSLQKQVETIEKKVTTLETSFQVFRDSKPKEPEQEIRNTIKPPKEDIKQNRSSIQPSKTEQPSQK